MTIEELQAQQHAALCHLNAVRRCRDVVLQDITKANKADELVSAHTLDLVDHLSLVESSAVRMFNDAYKAIDRKRTELAGLTSGLD